MYKRTGRRDYTHTLEGIWIELKSILSLKTVNKQLDVRISALRLEYTGYSQYEIRNIQLFVYRL